MVEGFLIYAQYQSVMSLKNNCCRWVCSIRLGIRSKYQDLYTCFYDLPLSFFYLKAPSSFQAAMSHLQVNQVSAYITEIINPR